MYEFSSIFIYFLSIIIVISAMTFVMLMTVVHEVSHRRHLLTLMAFCACNFLLQLLYLGMTIQDILIRYYRYSVYLRIADITLYTLQSYLWCRYLLFYPLKNTAVARHSKTACNTITGLALILGIYNYAFNINNEFLYENASAIAIELLTTLLISIMLILTIASLKRGFNKRFDTYNIVITVLLLFIQWSTDISLILETEVGFSFSAHEYLTGSLQQILLTFMLVLYVYRTDYSGATLHERLSAIVNSKMPSTEPMSDAVSSSTATTSFQNKNINYDKADAPIPNPVGSADAYDRNTIHNTAADAALSKSNAITAFDSASDIDAHNTDMYTVTSDCSAAINSNVTSTDSTSDSDIKVEMRSDDDSHLNLDPIDILFEQCQLTPREREVARLAYTGLTNPEIADKLCISQYTVKRHMHAVFEKLGISARIELVHLLSGH